MAQRFFSRFYTRVSGAMQDKKKAAADALEGLGIRVQGSQDKCHEP